METPGVVLAAKVIGWLQVAFVLVLTSAEVTFASSYGVFGTKIGFVAFLIGLVVASYFAIPLILLQRAWPAGRVVVIVTESLAGVVFVLLVFNFLVDTGTHGAAALVPALVCFTVAVLLCTPRAATWSASGRQRYPLPPSARTIPSPQTFGPERGAVPFPYRDGQQWGIPIPPPFHGPQGAASPPPPSPSAPTGSSPPPTSYWYQGPPVAPVPPTQPVAPAESSEEATPA